MTNENTYRFESNVSEEIASNYYTEKRYVRTVEIYFLRKHKELYQYQILCTKFDFSDQDTASGFLLKKISYLFDELDIYADEENNIVKVNNISNLRLKWQDLKVKMWETNKGDEVENYFRSISSVLDNEENLIAFLQSYNMFGLYFNGQLGQYPDDGKRIRVITEEKMEYLHKEISSEKEITIKMRAFENKDENPMEGISIYEKGVLKENFVKITENNCQIKYSLLWVG